MEIYVGIDIGGSHISAWAIGRNGKTYDPFSKIRISGGITSEELIRNLKDLVRDMVSHYSLHNDWIAAVGLASPGPLDPQKGIMIGPVNFLNINNLEIVKTLQDEIGLSVFLINDADAAVVGEAWLGSAQGFKDVVILTLGTGVGSGIIADGRLQRGRGMGGEWGHTTIQSSYEKPTSEKKIDEIRICSCRRLNCLEAFCGTEGLAKTYCNFFKVERSELKPDEVYSISENMMKNWELTSGLDDSLRNSNWNRVFRAYCRHLTEGILNIVNVHHPDCIVLGGGIANSAIVEQVKNNLGHPNPDDPFGRRYRFDHLLYGLEIRLATQSYSGIIGAAKHAMDCREAEIANHRTEHGVFS